MYDCIVIMWISIVDAQQNVLSFSPNTSLSLNSTSSFILVHRHHSGVSAQWAALDILGKGERALFNSPRLTGFPPAHQNKKRRPLSPWSRLMNIWDARRRCCLLDRLARRWRCMVGRNFFFSLLSSFEMYFGFCWGLNYWRLITCLLLSRWNLQTINYTVSNPWV